MPLFSLDGRRPAMPASGNIWIAPTACLIGDVRLGEDAGVWFGAVLRGDNEPIVVGARTNVQEHCVLHTDMGFPLEIGPDCTVGHHVILHGCTIGAGTLVGMGSVVMNGARIGTGCLIGACALITEGKAFRDRSLIMGSPAKVVRELNASEAESLAQAAAGYVRNGRRYRAGLIPLDGPPPAPAGR